MTQNKIDHHRNHSTFSDERFLCHPVWQNRT